VHPKPTSSSSDHSNTVSQKDLHDGFSFPLSVQQEDDLCSDSLFDTSDMNFGQFWDSHDYSGGLEGLSSSNSASFLPAGCPTPLETQSIFSPLSDVELPPPTVSFVVPPPPSLPTGTSHCCDIAGANNSDSYTPSATIGDISAMWSPIKHDPLDSILYECLDTFPKPVSLLETNPRPTEVQDVSPETRHATSMMISSSTDGQSKPQWIAQPAAQRPFSSETQTSQISSHPTKENDSPHSRFRGISPNQGSYSANVQPRFRGEPASKIQRRERNSISARKYRQRRLDRIAELEQALANMEVERDSLAVQLECWKTKAELLRELALGSRGSGCASNGTNHGPC